MALITKYAMNNKIFREIFGTKKHVAKSSDKTYSWINKINYYVTKIILQVVKLDLPKS